MATNQGLRGRGSFNVGIRFDGQWTKFNNLLSESPIIMGMAAREGQRRFAEEFRDKVKYNMLTGGKRFGYKPLSMRYLFRKISSGAVSSLFIRSKAMMNSVGVKENTAGTRFMVGIPKGLKRPNYSGESSKANRLEIHEYANILEHGAPTRNVAKRPVFSDTFTKDMGGKRGLKRFIELSLIKKFGIRGFRVNKI